jgi:hypothetical protein
MLEVHVIRPIAIDDYLARTFDLRTSNCWHLVRDVWRDMTGVDLGDLTPAQTDLDSLDDAVWAAIEGSRFLALQRPARACIVLMRRRGEMPHVGVLMKWRLLHMTPKGVRNPWLSDVAREWDSLEYYVPREAEKDLASWVSSR